MKKWLLTAVVCLFLSNLAEAASSTGGSTGVIDTPTADVVREGNFFAGYYRLEEGNVYSLGANAAKNLEVSFSSQENEPKGRASYFNAKYALKQEGILLPGIAIGVDDLGGREERSVYAVMSKALPLGFRIHLGYGNGRYDGAFYALEKRIMPAVAAGTFPDTSLLVEYDGRAMNYGLRVSLASGFKINAGWRDKETYVGLTYNFY